jgi:hypothetical protein
MYQVELLTGIYEMCPGTEYVIKNIEEKFKGNCVDSNSLQKLDDY